MKMRRRATETSPPRTGTPLVVAAPTPRRPTDSVGTAPLTRSEALLAMILDELRLMRESILRTEESAYRAEKLHVLALIAEGLGVESRVAVGFAPVEGEPGLFRGVFRNRLPRAVGIVAEVARGSAQAGALLYLAEHAPVPADVGGGRTPVVVLGPNDEAVMRLTGGDARIEVVVTDPLAGLYE